MNIDQIVHELKGERSRLDAAIAALQGAGRERKGSNGRKRRRHMSAAARRRISQAMKQRWAARKKRAGAA